MDSIAMFTDNAGRTIRISCDGDVEAYHEGRRIGRVGIDDMDIGTRICSIEVDASYRRAGIATELVRQVAAIYGSHIEKPSVNAVGGGDAPAESYYTDEGRGLIDKCIRLGILANEYHGE